MARGNSNSGPRAPMRKSIVVQRSIFSPLEANSAFNSASEEVPVVLVPAMHASWCYFYMSVPSGVYVLYQKHHKRQGLLPSGVKLCWPAYNRISHIVSAASMTYNAPVQSCPTSDNVMVDVDLSLTFQIGPTEAEAELFVYTLGAARFDELLSALTDEAIRGLVHTVPHDRLHDLREEFAVGMLRSLNRTVSGYGVIILNVKVTDVMLPQIVEDTLQEATEFKTRMEEQEKKHENSRNELVDQATQRLTEIQQRAERDAQEIAANRANALVAREQQKVDANSSAGVAITEAQTEIDVAVIRAESELTATQQQAEREREELLGAVRAECERRKVEAAQEARSRIIRAQALVQEAQSQAAIITAAAEAEAVNAAHLEHKRMQQLELRRLEVMAQLARKTKVVIGGSTGEGMLEQIVPGTAADMSANVGQAVVDSASSSSSS